MSFFGLVLELAFNTSKMQEKAYDQCTYTSLIRDNRQRYFPSSSLQEVNTSSLPPDRKIRKRYRAEFDKEINDVGLPPLDVVFRGVVSQNNNVKAE